MQEIDSRRRKYPAIICRDCGQSHLPNSGNSKRCRACTMKSRGQTGVGFVDRACRRCSEPYRPASSSQEFCPACRPLVRREKNIADLMERRRAAGATEVGSERPCSDCGKPYVFKSGPQKRCRNCQALANTRAATESTKRSPLRSLYRKRTQVRRAFGGNKPAVLERDGHACRKCGTKDRLCVHHIDGQGQGAPREARNHDMGNLITLCTICHRRLHVMAEKLFFLRHPEVAREALTMFIESAHSS